MSHGVVCKYHYRENFRVWLTSVTVWLFFREGVAKCPCKCGSVSEIYKRRLKHLRENKEVLYMTMLMNGTLKDHLEEVDKFAEDMFDQLVMQLKKQERITENLKATNQMEWVQRMNNIRSRAEEIVYQELIYV